MCVYWYVGIYVSVRVCKLVSADIFVNEYAYLQIYKYILANSRVVNVKSLVRIPHYWDMMFRLGGEMYNGGLSN